MIYIQTILIDIIMLCLISGCTLSFTNVSTHGNASDVVDEENVPSNRMEVPVAP